MVPSQVYMGLVRLPRLTTVKASVASLEGVSSLAPEKRHPEAVTGSIR
jgi:hypothetical protein